MNQVMRTLSVAPCPKCNGEDVDIFVRHGSGSFIVRCQCGNFRTSSGGLFATVHHWNMAAQKVASEKAHAESEKTRKEKAKLRCWTSKHPFRGDKYGLVIAPTMRAVAKIAGLTLREVNRTWACRASYNDRVFEPGKLYISVLGWGYGTGAWAWEFNVDSEGRPCQ